MIFLFDDGASTWSYTLSLHAARPGWIEELEEVDTDGVEPVTAVVHQGLPMREDVVTEGGDPAKVLANAPKTAKDFFVVPKVVE